jgi:hypothetical protein
MAFKRWSKAPSRKPPKKSWDKNEMKIIGWCLNRNISVGISPDWENDGIDWLIDVNINNKTHTDPNRYTNDTVYNKVNEYYKYYYDKYNKQ